MPLLLHGMAPADEGPAKSPGAGHCVPIGSLHAIVTPIPAGEADALAATGESAAENALAHHAVLTAWMRHRTVLPTRFGAVFSDKAALAAAIGPAERRLAAALSSLEGRAEFALSLRRTGPAPPAEPAGQTGRAFLLAKRAERDLGRSNAKAVAQLAHELSHHCAARCDRVLALSPRGGTVLSLALLAAKNGFDGLQRSTTALAGRAAALGLTLSLTGPMPAYSFVAADIFERDPAHDPT